MAIRPEPTATDSPLNWSAAFRPWFSMTMLEVKLPTKPPTVNIDVTTENAVSDIGMHVGKPWERKGGAARQVKVAWIWLRAEM